jgi:hypothetical protein
MPVLTCTRAATRVLVAGALAFGAAACGDDDDGGDAAPDTTADGSDGGEDAGDVQAPEEGGSATLTIGDETWEFSSVACAFGTEETQSEQWDFSLSAIQDGLQLSAERGAEGGPYGDIVEIDDIEDFENPSVSWVAPALTATSADAQQFLEVDGNQVTAEAEFSDNTADDPLQEPVSGTLEATCP